jgi:hypothetical protein
MSEALPSTLLIEEGAEEVGASMRRRAIAFLISPFGLVLAMRPQREREAARIAGEFGAALDFRRQQSSETSVLAHSRGLPAVRRERATNIGYVIFAAGIIGLGVVAAGVARGKSVASCELIRLNEVSVCSDALTAASQKRPLALPASRIGAPSGVANARYGDHIHWLDAWSRNLASD